MSAPPACREIKGTRFCWQDKEALRAIREGVEDYGSALAVYLAMTVVASDCGGEEFRATHQWLASLSGFSEKTVRLRLADLVRLKLVVVETPRLRAPCQYRLLAFGNGYQTSGSDFQAFGNGEAPPLPTSEEQKNRRTKPPLPPKGVESVSQAEAIYAEYPRKVGKPAALRAIIKAIAAHGFERVLERTVAYAKAREGQEPSYTPHPATWYRQERYLDDPATWARTPAANGAAHRAEIEALKREATTIRSSAREMQKPERQTRLREIENRLSELTTP